MTRKKRAAIVLETLDRLYPEVSVPLLHSDPFTLLVAVVLSAQCTDERVNQISPKLFKIAGTAAEMALLDRSIIKDVIRPCGLSERKSTAISELSKIIMRDYNGLVPNTMEDLEALPGVGHKTASVVISQAFGVPAFPVDTHIHRLAARWKLSDGSNVKKTESDLKKLFSIEKWNSIHLKIIFYGREYCPARGHDLNKCIICKTL
ncbi:MAG: endonuclease III [Saprospiraceae bacterium]|nr:endonuclease III [Saprospiraceae bacterium]